jgi:hypothetical protein
MSKKKLSNLKGYFSVLVDASNQCNMLNFQLGPNAMGTALASRSWNIKVKKHLKKAQKFVFEKKIT